MEIPTAPELDRLRRELLRQRNHLSARPAAEVTEKCADRIDRAAILSQYSAETSLRNQAALQINKIEAALARMSHGRYGVCAECEEPIGIRRLRANPAALHCLHCEGS